MQSSKVIEDYLLKALCSFEKSVLGVGKKADKNKFDRVLLDALEC